VGRLGVGSSRKRFRGGVFTGPCASPRARRWPHDDRSAHDVTAAPQLLIASVFLETGQLESSLRTATWDVWIALIVLAVGGYVVAVFDLVRAYATIFASTRSCRLRSS